MVLARNSAFDPEAIGACSGRILFHQAPTALRRALPCRDFDEQALATLTSSVLRSAPEVDAPSHVSRYATKVSWDWSRALRQVASNLMASCYRARRRFLRAANWHDVRTAC